MVFKRVDTANGRIMWFRGTELKDGNLVNGEMVSGQDVPEDVLRSLQSTGFYTLEEDLVPARKNNIPQRPQKNKPATRDCFVCGEPGTRSKYVNNYTAYMCDEHYNTMTTGQIVQSLREKESE